MTRVQGQRKRPCRVCGRWYQPTSRQRERQRTCGDPACVREWHRRNCRRWHRQNKQVTQATYLAERLVNAETSGAHKTAATAATPRSGAAVAAGYSRAALGHPEHGYRGVPGPKGHS